MMHFILFHLLQNNNNKLKITHLLRRKRNLPTLLSISQTFASLIRLHEDIIEKSMVLLLYHISFRT